MSTIEQIQFTRVKSDVSGNSRFVCHFFAFLTQSEINSYGMDNYDKLYALALSRSRQLGGKKFHNKQYGGGIVFQMCESEQAEMSQRIKAIALNIK